MKMGEKKLLIFLSNILFGILLIGYASAACSSPNQTIMKIYSSANAHGALWNDTSYTYDICYDGTAPANPHSCSGKKPILWLSSSSNSHASTTNSSVYKVPVCYGDLTCAYKSSCSSGETILFTLYQGTNSHISNSSSTYSIKACCKSGSPDLDSTRWTNLVNTNQISTAGLNDTVRLYVAGEGLENKQINYTIYKDVAFWFDQKIAQTSSYGFTKWKASEIGDFYFTAAIGTEQNYSNYLTVSAEQNSDPVAKITGPEDRQIYFINTPLNFTQASYDEDDDFTYEWNLGDGRKITGDSVSLRNWKFIESYSTPGQKNIVLLVTDSRGAIGRDQISIVILDSVKNNQTLAYIDSPRWGTGYGRTIEFNASGSYAVNYDGANVNCLNGRCPSATKNCPIGSAIGCTKPVSGWATISYDKLEFSWIFINGFTNKETSASSLHNPLVVVAFDTPSSFQNPHKARLTVTY